MTKKKILLFSCMLCSLLIYGQSSHSFLSASFSKDTSLLLPNYNTIKQGHTIATINDGFLYYCSDDAFQSAENNYDAIIYSCNLKNFSMDTIRLLFPLEGKKPDKEARFHLISSLYFINDWLVIAAQHKILLYKKNEEGNYSLHHRVYEYDVVYAYIFHDSLYSIVRNNEVGFDWYRYTDAGSSSKQRIRSLHSDAVFMNQFSPNSFFYVTNQRLYFMSSRDMNITVYCLDGSPVDHLTFSFEGWKKIPDAICREVDNLPYGMQRISKALSCHIFDYSFPKILLPLTDSTLIIRYNMPDSVGKYGQPYCAALLKENGQWEARQYRVNFPKDYRYTQYAFPFFLNDGTNVLSLTYNNKLYQISMEVPINPEGKTTSEYYDEYNAYLKDHDPVAKINQWSYRQPLLIRPDSLHLLNYDNKPFSNDSMRDKILIVLNRQPQCSGCQHVIYSFFNDLKFNNVSLVFSCHNGGTYLQKRETDANVRKYFSKTYLPLFFNTEENYNSKIFLQKDIAFPAVLLWKKENRTGQLFDVNDIFTPDVRTYRFSDYFMDVLYDFLDS